MSEAPASAASTPAAAAPATGDTTAPAAQSAPATAAVVAATIATPATTTTTETAAAPDNAQALLDAREYLKGVVSDDKALEGKTDAEVMALAQGAKALAEKNGVAPDKYEAFKVPAGAELNATVITEFEATAKELGLSQDKAQTLIDKLAPTLAKQTTASFNATLVKADAEWQAASKADPEFGGDKFDENMVLAKRTMDTLGTPELTKLLNDSRMGNHPEWVRLAVRVGKMLSPDGKHVTGAQPGQGETSLADRLYPPKTQ